MATIDLIVLGMLKKDSLSAYDIQKLVEYRNISVAGAMPLASTVIILLIGVEAKRLTNSTPIDFIKIGSPGGKRNNICNCQ